MRVIPEALATKCRSNHIHQELYDKTFLECTFVEFVDGAGYFASLNGDLKTLLQMPSTHSFFQIKSAPIRLRRELQQLGYLTPLEIEHALFCAGGDKKQSVAMLVQDGYTNAEIERVLAWMLEEAHLHLDGGKCIVSEKGLSCPGGISFWMSLPFMALLFQYNRTWDISWFLGMDHFTA